MISIGNSAEKSCTMSNPSGSTADRQSSITCSTIGLSDAMARGVNTLLSRLRMCRCSGGSIMMIDLCGGGVSLRTMARSTPRAEEYVAKSLKAAATSACRLSA